MMGQLAMHGYTLVDSLDAAEICVVNSCTVKNPAESRGLHLATGQRYGTLGVREKPLATFKGVPP
jgi:tRNA A37 methylthiotransferase MiaB